MGRGFFSNLESTALPLFQIAGIEKAIPIEKTIPSIVQEPLFSYHSSMAGLEKIGVRPSSKKKEKLKEPEEYRVILLNDNYTTMEFVVAVLISIFQKSEGEAKRIMLDVHRKGRGTVGFYPWDIAQTKAAQVHAEAGRRGFPLRCLVEQA
jgi:ATP-dependent Clp protease adaptor protein ClpS